MWHCYQEEAQQQQQEQQQLMANGIGNNVLRVCVCVYTDCPHIICGNPTAGSTATPTRWLQFLLLLLLLLRVLVA